LGPRRSRSPGFGPRRSCSPGFGPRRSRSPRFGPRRSRSPGFSRRRSRSPGFGPRRSRSPGFGPRRSRSPGFSRGRSRSPGFYRRRSRSPGFGPGRPLSPGQFYCGPPFSPDGPPPGYWFMRSGFRGRGHWHRDRSPRRASPRYSSRSPSVERLSGVESSDESIDAHRITCPLGAPEMDPQFMHPPEMDPQFMHPLGPPCPPGPPFMFRGRGRGGPFRGGPPFRGCGPF
jgi:hypothetical protein